MRKYLLAVALLSLTVLTNCGQLKIISNEEKASTAASLKADYKLIGDKIVRFDPRSKKNNPKVYYEIVGDRVVKVDRSNINFTDDNIPMPIKRLVPKQKKKKFITSAPMFTPKKKVQPFVTSKPMFRFKPKEHRKLPKILETSFDKTKSFWFEEIVPKFPDGYNVNRYTLKEEEGKREEIKPDMESYVGEDIGEGEIDTAFEDNYFEDIANPSEVDADVDIVGIDSSIERQLTQVPDHEDLSAEYINMLGDEAENYEIVEDVDAVNGKVSDRVFFKHGSSAISKSDKDKIKKLSGNLSNFEDEYTLSVVGHASKRVDGVTDPKIKRAINFKMAKQRADKVSGEFKRHGIDSKMILAVSKGADTPNPDPGNMTQEEADRRVDIFLDAQDYYY